MPSHSSETNQNTHTRRNFLAASAAGLCASTITKKGFAQPAAASLRIRRSALELPANDPIFAAYADAVHRMHQLPASDRRSWRYQAEIHPRFCHNAGAIFLPWHRHYVNQFEKICGDLIGDSSFALPYWDWTYEGGKIPDAFFDIDKLNVTYWNDDGVADFPSNWRNINSRGVRGLGKGDRAQDDPIRGGNFTSSMIRRIMRSSTFDTFQDQLEVTPHNSGHVVVGQVAMRPVGHMLDGLSPLDPLFWLHHCNVDRIWAEWQMAGNTTPPFNQNYNGHFANEAGDLVNLAADDSTDFESLGYSFDTIESIGAPREFLRAVGVETNPLAPSDAEAPELETLASVELGVSMPLNSPFPVEVGIDQLESRLAESFEVRNAMIPAPRVLQAFTGNPAEGLVEFGKPQRIRNRIYLLVEHAKRNSMASPSVNVFLNCRYLTPQTPYTDDHFAGSFSFFDHDSSHAQANGHHMGHDFLVDITDAIERLGLSEGNLTVQLLPIVPESAIEENGVSVKGLKILST